jgi:hypothetical protein
MEGKFNIHTRYDATKDIGTVKAKFLYQETCPCGICGGQSGTRRVFFPNISVLACHCRSIHIFLIQTNLFIISLYNLSNRECCLMRTLTKRVRHLKVRSFGGDYF